MNAHKALQKEKFSLIDYETDIVAWANEQAWLVRNKKFEFLDIEHIAEEIEDVGKIEQRELANRMVVLIAHLLKWQFQPECQSRSWQLTIRNQRKAISIHLKEVPTSSTSTATLTKYLFFNSWDHLMSFMFEQLKIPKTG
ncbi:MAG: DUF29 domain-containing protein [Desulfamplus sp.]|nr:DUF29 domain-containing protein [Desulfamplus sp.]